MRIAIITTDEQRAAVAKAVVAARLIRDRIEQAEIVELAAGDNPGGSVAYKPLTVWGPTPDGKDADLLGRELLWVDNAAHDTNCRLTGDDVSTLTVTLAAAGAMDPNVFGAVNLAETDETCGTWELDITALLKVWLDDTTKQLVEWIGTLGKTPEDIEDLVFATAVRPGSDEEQVAADNELADEINEGGVEKQARFLIERLGVKTAFAAVQAHTAAND